MKKFVAFFAALVILISMMVVSGLAAEYSPNYPNSGMLEVSQYINVNGSRISGEPPYCYFEENFSPGSYDYKVIKYFSDMRNDILWGTYNNMGTDYVKNRVSDFYSSFTEIVCLERRVICALKIPPNGNYDALSDDEKVVVDYNELTNRGKKTVLELGQAIFSIDRPFSYHLSDNDVEIMRRKNDVIHDIRRKMITHN